MDPLDEAEAEAIAIALVFRLRVGSMPPDEAYQWTRYLCEVWRARRDLDPAPLTYRLTLP